MNTLALGLNPINPSLYYTTAAQFGKGALRNWGLTHTLANQIDNEVRVASELSKPLVTHLSVKPLNYGNKRITQDKPSSMTWGKAQTIVHDNYTGTPHRQIGTIENGEIHSPLIGNFIDNGTEQMVYSSTTNPQNYMKVYADKAFQNGFPSVDAIKNFHQHFMKRNQVPIYQRQYYQGYLKDKSGTLFPVYS